MVLKWGHRVHKDKKPGEVCTLCVWLGLFFHVLELAQFRQVQEERTEVWPGSARFQAWLDPGGKAKLLELSEELHLSLQHELADYRCE